MIYKNIWLMVFVVCGTYQMTMCCNHRHTNYSATQQRLGPERGWHMLERSGTMQVYDPTLFRRNVQLSVALDAEQARIKQLRHKAKVREDEIARLAQCIISIDEENAQKEQEKLKDIEALLEKCHQQEKEIESLKKAAEDRQSESESLEV